MACYACAELPCFCWRLMHRAFGVDQDGLEALLREGVFHLRTCKLCDDGVVVKGALCLLAWGGMRAGVQLRTHCGLGAELLTGARDMRASAGYHV